MADTRVEVDLERNSPYRVALELAFMIAKAEDKLTVSGPNGDRKYWLDLYAKCRRVVVKGDSAQYALKQGSGDDEE